MNARNLSFARTLRPARRRRAARLDCRPAVESFERRELMAAGVFLQGTAFVDSNANGAFDLGEAKLAGATVKLYDAAGTTQLATATTAADGSYKFTDANVAGGLAADTTYKLVESAAGYSNTGAQPLSQVLKATATSTSTIQVTTVDVTKVTTTFTSPVSPFDRIFFTVNGAAESIVPTQLNVTLSGDPNVSTTSFPALCVGINDRLGFNAPYSTLVGTQAELPNGGQIAYLFNHYGTTLPASASTLPANLQAFSTKNLMAGVQVAIWQLEYGNSLVLTGYDTNYTSAQDYADLNTAAAFFVSDAAGKSELSAVLDASLTGTLPAAGLSGQSLLATGSLNFGNAPIPLGSLSGFVYVDNNNSGQKLAGDAPIAGVTLTLVRTDTASPVTIGTTTTAADGSYSFAGLAPGTYKVVETQPSAYLDGLDSRNGAIIAGSAAGGDTVAGIVVTAGNNSPSNNFGEVAPASVAGTVYFDKDNSGSLTTGDTGLSGVTVTLTGTNDLGPIAPIVATTGPGGTYSFGNLRPGTYSVSETQPAGYAQGTDTVGTVGTATTGTLSSTDVFSGVTLAPGTAGVAYNFGELGASISGTVYYDANKSATLDAGDSGLGGLTVTLKNSAGAVVATTTTAANGTYSFPNVAPGSYTVVESVKPGYGTDTPTTLPVTVAATPITGVNFGETLGSVAGTVYFDKDASGTLTAGDTPIAGVTVSLLSSTGSVISTTTTAADGTYSFNGLLAGTYGVSEAQPAGYAQGTDTPGSAGGSVSAVDVITGANLPAGVAAVGYNFGELGTGISGTVYYDANKSATLDAGDSGLGGLTVTLKNSAGAVVATTTTAANGTYSFPNVAPGSYTVVESVKPGYGTDTPTTLPVTVAATPVTGVNFGQTLGSLAGNVYFDNDASGTLSTNDLPLGGVTVNLLNSAGTVIQTTTTAADGTYLFTGLTAGTYGVSEVQPALYSQGTDTPGSVGGSVTAVDVITGAVLPAGVAAVSYNFGETYTCDATLSHVYYTINGSTVVNDLRGNVHSGDTVSATFTVAAGHTDLMSLVSYSAPAGYFDANTASQQVVFNQAGGSFGPGTYTISVVVPNSYFQVDFVCGPVIPTLGPAGSNNFYSAQNRLDSADNGGCQAITTSSLTGTVFADSNLDGVQNNGEKGIAGVAVTLTGKTYAGVPYTAAATTNANGGYAFNGVPAGVYAVAEATPAGYTDGKATAGTSGGVASPGKVVSIPLNSNTGAVAYNFPEQSPVAIKGTAFVDKTGNGLSGEDTPQSGVTINLYRDANGDGVLTAADGNPVATATTLADGTYLFTGLPVGTYFVQEVTPGGYVQTAPYPSTYTVLATTSPTLSANNNFDNYSLACDTSKITCIYYVINGCTTVTDLSGHVNPGDTVKAYFTVTGMSQTLTLVSYNAPTTDLQSQTIYCVASGTYAPGSYCLSVTVPCGNFQVDFVCGRAIDHFGPTGSNIRYHAEQRFISSDSQYNVATGCFYGSRPLDDDSVDVGCVGLPGSTTRDGQGNYTVQGSGSDIWNNADAFTFDSQGLDGDGEIVAHVKDVAWTDSWAKAGVMIRQSADPSSPHAFVALTPGNGLAFQYRQSFGGCSSNVNTGSTPANGAWVKLVRTGDTFSGYTSADGVNYTLLGTASIPMGTHVQIGLAVTSHNNCALTTAHFDNVGTNGFWANANGQCAIKAFDGCQTSTRLANYLASTLPNLCGWLWGKTNLDVANLALQCAAGGNNISECILAAALKCYATSSNLGGNTGGSACGFTVTGGGCGSTVVNVGNCGAAFDVSNGCNLTINQLLSATNRKSWNNSIYCGNSTWISQGFSLYGSLCR